MVTVCAQDLRSRSVTVYGHSLRSRSALTIYSHGLCSRSTLTVYGHSLRSRSTNLRSLSTVPVCAHDLRSRTVCISIVRPPRSLRNRLYLSFGMSYGRGTNCVMGILQNGSAELPVALLLYMGEANFLEYLVPPY